MAVPDVSDRSLSELISLTGRRAVVTGAGRGLGSAICRRLVEGGASVVVADLDLESAGQSVASLTNSGGRAEPAQVDVADAESVRALADEAEEKLGGIDLWVNNAGIYPDTAVHEITADEFGRVLGVNLLGTFLGAREAGRRMIAADHGGTIVNIAMSHNYTREGAAHYVASKHGVEALTRRLSVEFGPHAIRVLAVAPALMMTPGVAEEAARHDWDLSEIEAATAATLPLGRIAVPDDIARVVVFAASDMAMLMTGSTLHVDAGDTG